MDAGGAVLDRQARHQVHRHAGVAGSAARRRSVGDGGVPAPDADLDAAAYRRLVYGRATAVGSAANLSLQDRRTASRARRLLAMSWCERHRQRAGAFPSLAGQRAEYLRSLRAFREPTRFSGIMSAVAATLRRRRDARDCGVLRRLPPRWLPPRPRRRQAARGGYRARGAPDRDIPACVECHGPTAQPKNRAYPRLAGQHLRYLTSQLKLLKERRRGGSPT